MVNGINIETKMPEPDSLRDHQHLVDLGKWVRMAIQRVWPTRMNPGYVIVVFDPHTGEIGLEVRGDLGHCQAAMDAAKGALKEHLKPAVLQ